MVCREIALSKNVCQVCLLDLDYGIPVQARDAALGREREMLAKSDVNIEYQTEQIAKQLANGGAPLKKKIHYTLLHHCHPIPTQPRQAAAFAL